MSEKIGLNIHSDFLGDDKPKEKKPSLDEVLHTENASPEELQAAVEALFEQAPGGSGHTLSDQEVSQAEQEIAEATPEEIPAEDPHAALHAYLEEAAQQETVTAEETEEAEAPHYSRRQRSHYEEEESFSLPWGGPILWSGLHVAIAALLAFLGLTWTYTQEQNLYMAWAQHQGLDAYRSVFGTNGILFYLTSWIGSLGFGPYLWVAFQFPVLVWAGRELSKLTLQVTASPVKARQILPVFYLLVLGLGLGGFYASIFIFPLLFWAARRIQDNVEVAWTAPAAMRYGLVAGLTFMLDPFTALVFYGVSTLVMAFYNFSHKRVAQGVYQFLAAAIGFSISFYLIGYYTVWIGTLGDAIDQTLYPLTGLGIHPDLLLRNGLEYGLITLALGGASYWIASFAAKPQGANSVLAWMGRLGVIAILPLLILGDQSGTDKLLSVLPYIFFLILPSLAKDALTEDEAGSKPVLTSYLQASFYLPLLALVYVVGAPLVERFVLEGGLSQERGRVAAFVAEKTKDSDYIYAWDDTAKIYLDSKRQAGSLYISPAHYTQSAAHRIKIENNLSFVRPKYMVVNPNVTMDAEVARTLKESYKEVSVDGVKNLKVYENK